MDVKHFRIKTQDQNDFNQMTNEIKNLNNFTNVIDVIGSINQKCKFDYNSENDILNLYIAIPATYSDLSVIFDLPRSFEVNLYYALRLIITIAKIHKAGYLHGDIQPENFLMFNNYLIMLGNLQYMK